MKKLTPAEMILNIMENFNFERVQETMQALDWKWSSGLGFIIPDEQELRRTARMLLEDTVKLLMTDPGAKPNMPCSVGTGGFRASGYKSKKGNIVELELQFIVTGWETQRKSYE